MDELARLRDEGYIQTSGCTMRTFDNSRPGKVGLWPDAIVAGEEVIVPHGVSPAEGKCWKATPDNAKRFIANGYSFIRRLAFEDRTDLDRIAVAALEFCSGVSRNLKGEMDVTKAIRGPQFLDFLAKNGVTADWASFGDGDDTLVKNSSRCRIYELEGAGFLFRIFAMFVTPVSEEGKPLEFTTPFHDLIVGENGFVKQVKDANERKPDATFIVLGIPEPAGRGIQPVHLKEVFEIVATPNARNGIRGWNRELGWRINRPSVDKLGNAERALLYSMYPEEVEEIARVIRRYAETCVGSEFTIGELREAAGLPVGDEALVCRACNRLLKNGGYHVRIDIHNNHELVLAKGRPENRQEVKLRFDDPLSQDAKRSRALWKVAKYTLTFSLGMVLGVGVCWFTHHHVWQSITGAVIPFLCPIGFGMCKSYLIQRSTKAVFGLLVEFIGQDM